MSATQETRVEWFGSLEVHQPIRTSIHTTATETSVSCA